MTTLAQALSRAADLLRDGADPEYRRGIVNLIAELYPDEERPIDETIVDLDAMIDRIIAASS